MRMKALLCAAVFAAGIATSLADNVYSLNVVGYYNITIPAHNGNPSQPLNMHAAMIANQFNTTNNTLNALIPSGPVNAQVNKYTPGSGFAAATFDEFDLVWIPNYSFNPGEGALFVNPITQTTPLTLTFVGEVPQGTMTTPIPPGFSGAAQFYPKAWALNDVDAAFPAVPNDQIFTFVTGSGFTASAFDEIDLTWVPNTTIKVGEGFLINKQGTNNWTRSFTVQ